jgi:hypothetical protein
MKVKVSEIKPNLKNPRIIKDDKFQKLVNSIKEFPEMLEKRPLVCYTDVDKKLVILGGNMRFKAAKELGIKELSVVLADDWTEEQKAQFLIKDNLGYGEWDWNIIANEWDETNLNDWGLDIPVFESPKDLDYSLLDDVDMSNELSDMASNIKKAIQIEFEIEHYDEANELVKFWREQGLYIGGFIMEKLKEEKLKL